MFWSVVYALVRRLLGALLGEDDRRLEVENAVLRHQLAVLRRTTRRATLRRRDRVLLAAASRLLPRERWSMFLVSPQTLLRWHSVTALVLAAPAGEAHLARGEPPADISRHDILGGVIHEYYPQQPETPAPGCHERRASSVAAR